MEAAIVGVIDEGGDGSFEFALEDVVFQQNAGRQSLLLVLRCPPAVCLQSLAG